MVDRLPAIPFMSWNMFWLELKLLQKLNQKLYMHKKGFRIHLLIERCLLKT